ncbi:hypothetical protein SAMN05216404_11728 [Nitrosospira multiformis]|uniref:Uncharacterized protein n=1 Tax=Nitrosospira multiformis TaxID=1231 RepID=A0A1H8NPL4_9PROT|nr:hypothetical protein SAMN05216404_11728 [Nitrosospira multiformis]
MKKLMWVALQFTNISAERAVKTVGRDIANSSARSLNQPSIFLGTPHVGGEDSNK